MLNAIGGVLFLTLALALGLTAFTRPIDRRRLPHRLEMLRPSLAERHHPADHPCARWADQDLLTPQQTHDFLNALETIAAADLHVLLPVLAMIRAANHRAEAKAHAHTAHQEVFDEATAALPWIDRQRLRTGRHDIEDLLPMLQSLRDADARAQRDQERAQRLLRHLDGIETESLMAMIEDWRVPLASRTAQAALTYDVADMVTQGRMEALEEALARFKHHYGRYPKGFSELLGHLKRIGRLPAVLERGMERDGTLRDGWLRSFEYYPIRQTGYRLTSQGPSADTEVDDFVSTFSAQDGQQRNW